MIVALSKSKSVTFLCNLPWNRAKVSKGEDPCSLNSDRINSYIICITSGRGDDQPGFLI